MSPSDERPSPALDAMMRWFWQLVGVLLMLLVPAVMLYAAITTGFSGPGEQETCTPVGFTDSDC